MIRNFLYEGSIKLTVYLDGDNSYCLYDGKRMESNYSQRTYEIWINENMDIMTEITELCKMDIKKHSMTEWQVKNYGTAFWRANIGTDNMSDPGFLTNF